MKLGIYRDSEWCNCMKAGQNMIYGEIINDVMFLFMYIQAKTWDGVNAGQNKYKISQITLA